MMMTQRQAIKAAERKAAKTGRKVRRLAEDLQATHAELAGHKLRMDALQAEGRWLLTKLERQRRALAELEGRP